MNLNELIPNILRFPFGNLTDFLYLCNAIITNIQYSMFNNQCNTMGRMELAQSYFPYIQPRSAWLKFKTLLLEDPDLSGFAKQRRRTFLPSEVNIIYQHLGHP